MVPVPVDREHAVAVDAKLSQSVALLRSWDEGRLQCIISRSTSREWDPAARVPGRRGEIVDEVRGRSGNSVTGLVTLVSRTPSGCRQPPKLRKSPGARRVSFSTRFHEPFVPDIRDTYDHVYLRCRPYLSFLISLQKVLCRDHSMVREFSICTKE